MDPVQMRPNSSIEQMKTSDGYGTSDKTGSNAIL